MKHISFLILLILALAVPASAADITIKWAAQSAGATPWDEVRVYERQASGAFDIVAVVPGTAAKATVPNVTEGQHEYFLRAYVKPWESADSAAVVTPEIPSAPVDVGLE